MKIFSQKYKIKIFYINYDCNFRIKTSFSIRKNKESVLDHSGDASNHIFVGLSQL